MKSIVLEVLRDGPPHNQLLSPLTKYLALCGEHAAISMQLGFEHAQWLARMASLSYRDSEETRTLQLADVAAAMGGLIAQVPGLVAELTKCRPLPGDANTAAALTRPQTVQLRLVLNANELAFLPLELATAPPGFAASGQCLALQTEVPLCITREIRRATTVDLQWWRPPKILFAFAHPGSDVPYQQHLLALRAAIEPWVRSEEGADAKTQRAAVAQHLTVLPRASVRALNDLCAREPFTHIHILAHGVPYRRGDDRRFGLALHDAINPHVADIVDGERLAAALRPHVHDRSQKLATPLVVSVASCDSSNMGSVIGAGASVAHELHLKGVPLVVASQFPLTVQGSIVMVDVLFRGLLWGQDPRCVLDDLRRRLKALIPTSHDWASVVAYSALPSDIGEQSDRLAFQQARDSIQAALHSADAMVGSLAPRSQGAPALSGSNPSDDKRWREVRGRVDKIEYLLAAPSRKLEEAGRRLQNLLAVSSKKSEISGLLAATEKRIAELHVMAALRLQQETTWSEEKQSQQPLLGPEEILRAYQSARERLVTARQWYRDTFSSNRTESWALVQELALDLVLEPRYQTHLPEPDIRDDTPDSPVVVLRSRWRQRWFLAKLMAEQDLTHTDLLRELWAQGNLLELHLMAQVWAGGLWFTNPPVLADTVEQHRSRARELAKRIVEASPMYALEVASVRRQIRRYVEFFPAIAQTNLSDLVDEANYLVALLDAN